MSDRPLLEIENLRLSLGRGEAQKEVLRGIDIAVAAGESVGIVGESGSGKTMTVRSVMRLLPASAQLTGRINFDGREMLTMAPKELRRLRGAEMGMIFQDPHAAINPVRTLGDFLIEPWPGSRSRQRQERRRAEEILERVGLADPHAVMRMYPHEVSGGMLQRVMIGSVIMARPKLMLADEVTTALDVTTQSDVVALLTELRREQGSSMLFITHDIELAAATCDRILVMYRGVVVEDLTPTQLYAGESTEPYTRELLACRPNVGARVKRLPVINPEDWEGRYL